MKNKIVFVFIFLVVVILILGWRMTTLTFDLKQEKVKSEAEAYKTELVTRQLKRKAKEDLVNYRDSIRQATIDSLLSSNSKYKKKVYNQIKAIKTAPDSVKDSLWLDEWSKQEGSLLNNQPNRIK